MKMVLSVMTAMCVAGVAAADGVTREISGTTYTLTVPEGVVETMTADDVSAIGDGTGAVTELCKKGPGTLVAVSIPAFKGTIRVSAGYYRISAVDHCGTPHGPTVVESGATLEVDDWLTFESEEFVISGWGASDSTGVIHLMDWDQINLAKVTMAGDCYVTGTDNCHFFTLLGTEGNVFDMNGHTMTFETGNAVFLDRPEIVDPGHFAVWGRSLRINDGTVLDHGKEHTITIAQGRRHSDAGISFWDNRMTVSNNWTIVYDNPTSAEGIYCNTEGGTFYHDVVFGTDVESAGLLGSGRVTIIGSLKGACQEVNVGRSVFCGDTSEFTGTILCAQGAVAGGMQSIEPASALGKSNWTWLMKTESTGGYGYTADEFRDEILANYSPYYTYVYVNDGDVFDYPGSIRGIFSGSGRFYNNGPGVFSFSGDVSVNDLKCFQPGAGPVRLSGIHAGNIVTGGVDYYPTPGGRLEFADFNARSESWKSYHLSSPGDAAGIMEVAFTNVSLDARADGNAFCIGTVSAAYGKTCMEILSGCAVTNALVIGNSWNGVNDNWSAGGFYVRGGYLCVPMNPGVGDFCIGKHTHGYFEQTGGEVDAEYYVRVGATADSTGMFRQSAGRFTVKQSRYHLGAEGRAVHYQTGGLFESMADITLCDSSYNTLDGGTAAEMTVSGAGTECVIDRRVFLARRFDCVATLNVNDGGRLSAGEIVRARYGRDDNPSPLWYTNDYGYVNFNGGVFRAVQNGWDIFGNDTGAYNAALGEHSPNRPTAVTIFRKGATIEVPDGNTAFVSTPLRGPSGNGVLSITLPEDFDLAAYVAPPDVTIAGDGVNATAVATIDSVNKTLTGIVVTSPGSGYTWAKATVSGGGKPDTCEIDCVLGDVSGGGLTKTGSGTLVLSAVNTYTGKTRVDSGTLRIAPAGRIAAESAVSIASGATLEVQNSQSFASVSGEGSLTGDVSVSSFVADASASDCLSVDGVLTIGANPTVSLVNLPDGLDDESFGRILIPVVSAGSYEGLENLASASFTGADLPDGVTAVFRVNQSGVYVRVGRKTGFTVIVR